MAKYKYDYYSTGAIALNSSCSYTRVALNRITRFLFGEGGSLNQVFNCGVGAFVKFQTKLEINKSRAYLTTKIYRYCIKNAIEINERNFPSKDIQEFSEEPTFEKFINYIKNEKS